MGQERKRDVTYEEHAHFKHKRVRAFDQFKIIGWVLLNCGLLSIAVGIVILVVGQSVDVFPIKAGSPIWSGITVLIVCVFAFVIGCYNPHYFNETDSNKLQSWILSYTISAFISLVLCVISLGFTIYGTVRCATWKTQYGSQMLLCGSNYDAQVVMHVAACLLSIFEIIFLIYGIVLFFVYKDVYKFYDWEIGFYNDYFYTMPRETRIIDNSHYVIADSSPIVEKVQYVNAEKPLYLENTNYTVKQKDAMQPANVVSEYNTSNHKYLVLRLDRNQIRPI